MWSLLQLCSLHAKICVIRFFTQKNENEMTTDVFWANLSDCKTGLTAVYNTFKNQQYLPNGC